MPFYDLTTLNPSFKHLDPYANAAHPPVFPPAHLDQFGELCSILHRFGVTLAVSLPHGEGRPGQAVQLSHMTVGQAWSPLFVADSAFLTCWTGLGLHLARAARRSSFIRSSSVDICVMWAAVDPENMLSEQVNRMEFNPISGK